ncbi:dhhc zinc finger domain containing protein [Stylonychia lemnae]|uniref:Palmitoyltransferase n=1 Tax=Stylonychia lemnae TaxID=5949 RepID=A0A078AKL0_STYLE|nr:dhhc zinc finger domain containing protein [Stylonychia lemnae]|eukprot:CDW81358.1 dhhc zinc finger domain containing protein [Stylonychia lemnae]
MESQKTKNATPGGGYSAPSTNTQSSQNQKSGETTHVEYNPTVGTSSGAQESLVPVGYFMIQITSIVILMKSQYDSNLFELNFTTVSFITLTLLTFAYYLSCSFTNPGYVLGNHFLDGGSAGVYNPNLDPTKKEVYAGDLNNFKGQLNKKGYHNRKTSVLTKGLQISRHERNKSKQLGPQQLVLPESTLENLDTYPSQLYPSNSNQNVYGTNYEKIQQSISTLTTPTGSISPISFNSEKNGLAGGHKRMPSFIKSIPLTKVNKSPNSHEQNRKKVYEIISQKITQSNATITTMNDDELNTYQDQNEDQNIANLNNNNLYQLNLQENDSSPTRNNVSVLSFKEKFDQDKLVTINASTQERTNLDDDIIGQQFQTQTSPKQLQINQQSLNQAQANQAQNSANKNTVGEIQKRALISRYQMRSDQMCLQVIDSVIEEGESFDNYQDIELGMAVPNSKKNKINKKRQDKQNQMFQSNTSHNQLNDEQNAYTDEIENQGNQEKHSQPIDDENDDVILFVEYKYCTVCHIEQPLRCKHCKNCDHCVATYDHHCPWIGNCVGERNRKNFFWFLIYQSFQLIFALLIVITRLSQLIIVCRCIDQQKLISIDKLATIDTQLLIGHCDFRLFLHGIIFTSISCVLGFKKSHNLYFFIIQFSLGEYLSWMKISYMKVWPKRYGSPFSKNSLKANLRLYFCHKFAKSKQIYQWHMPNKLPKLK